MKGCCICSQIEGRKDDDLISALLKEDHYTRRVPIENDFFAVIPSLGPLAEGHVILSPREHLRNFSALPYHYFPAYDLIKNQLTTKLKNAFNKPIHIFEQGQALSGTRIFCSTDHAHFHFIPTDKNVWNELESFLEWKPFVNHISELASIVQGAEYIYYENPDGKSFIATGEEGTFAMQVMRKFFSQLFHADKEWNWRTDPTPEAADRLYRILR